MSLRSEIAALRAELEKLRASAAATNTAGQTETPPQPEQHTQTTLDALLRAVGETVTDIEDDIETYPRLAVLAAFGLGLCLGLAVRPHRP